MPTLYVENVPAELYSALKARAKEKHSSIAAAVIELLTENLPGESELERRRTLVQRAQALRARHSGGGSYPTAEQMQREDRGR